MGCGSGKVSKSKVASNASNAQRGAAKPPAPTSKVIQPGSFSDIYTIGEVLAHLTHGEIRKCIHKASGLQRSVKIVKQADLGSSISSEKFINREVKTLSSLDHPNILKIYDILYDTKNFFIIMENWEGGRLFEVIQQLESFNEAQVANIIEQLLSALSYAHERKVMHRDINPSVIFLMNKGTNFWVKIGEFGSSAFIDVDHKFEGKFEQSYYVAPEAFGDVYNEKCDLWSVGVIAYTLFAGVPPFENKGCAGIKEAMLNEPLDKELLQSRGASPGAIDLISNLLQKNYCDRPSAKDALQHSWITTFKQENAPSPTVLQQSLNNLKVFSSSVGLKGALHSFIANQVVCGQEMKDMRDCFKTLDINGDGKLCKNELKRYYESQMPPEEAEKLVEDIMNQIDTDHSGKIEYSEFITAFALQNKLVNRRNLEAAFKMLDRDASGALCIDELAELFSDIPVAKGGMNFQQLILEADKNGDGQVDLAEFSELLLTKLT